jgi:mono/diheme cytochrome c family protein
MKAGKMRRWSVVLFGGGFVLLLLSFLPQPAGQPETLENERPTVVAVELVTEQPSNEGPSASEGPSADEGAALFQAKGCPACHRHDGVGSSGFSTQIGPNLTNYEPDPDFIWDWLRDPEAIRPNTQMPDLNLSEEEIAVLVAFLEE